MRIKARRLLALLGKMAGVEECVRVQCDHNHRDPGNWVPFSGAGGVGVAKTKFEDEIRPISASGPQFRP